MSDDSGDLSQFAARLDRWGGDLDAWPDREAAAQARQLVMADPAARRAWDEAKRLDDLIAQHLDRLGAGAREARIAERAVAEVAARLPARRPELRVWLPRIAASVIAAAVLGGTFDWLVLQPPADAGPEIVALESFVYGPGEVEVR